VAGLSNKEIAGVFRQIEVLTRVLGESEQRAQTHGVMAWRIDRMPEPVADLAAAGRLVDLKGFGKSTQETIQELLDTGSCRRLDDLAARVPPGVPELLKVPGLGPKRVHQVITELGIDSLEQLEEAARDGSLASLKGLGKKTAEKVLEGIAFLARTRGCLRLDDALATAAATAQEFGIEGPTFAGPLRRGEVLVDTLAIVAVASPADVEPEGARLEDGVWVVPRGAAPGVRIRLVERKNLARALFEETGPAGHVAEVLARDGSDGSEEEIYASRGLHFVPPERRHACDGSQPVELVDADDLRGLVHAHTRWSDGKLTLEEMVEAAKARGYTYLGLTDHSYHAQYANGLDTDRLLEQGREVKDFNARTRDFRVLHGVEVDILPDGTLDYSDEVLAELDFVIASVHMAFTQDAKTITARIERAIRNPHVDILGHPTGRLLLRRDPYPVDMERILEVAAETGTCIELNASPWRLDLDPDLHARARELGIGVPICPDAHSDTNMDAVAWGVLAARRGGLRAADVPNTRDAQGFLEAIGR